MTFDRLIRVGGGADRNLLARPCGTIQLAHQDLDDVVLDENHRGELVARVHFELHVITAGEAVMTAVRAAPVRVEGPVERHAFDAVERGAAGDLLIARLIGARFRLGERGGSALLHEFCDSPGGGPGRAQIKQCHSLYVRLMMRAPATLVKLRR